MPFTKHSLFTVILSSVFWGVGAEGGGWCGEGVGITQGGFRGSRYSNNF